MDHFKFDVFYHFGAYVSYMVEKALATLNAIFFGKSFTMPMFWQIPNYKP